MAENENNNADFDETVHNTHPTLRPAPPMTREEFAEKARALIDEMLEDHEEQTGVGDDETHDWEYWSTELSNAYLNS